MIYVAVMIAHEVSFDIGDTSNHTTVGQVLLEIAGHMRQIVLKIMHEVVLLSLINFFRAESST